MSELIRQNTDFIKKVLASGGADLMKCYQCGTCSVVCNPTPNEKPFPRKEMLYAQWGMKDKLMSDPDIWLCHQCSDCTFHCPRGAKPGEVIGALRKLAIAEYSFPKFAGRIVGDPKYLIPLFFVPVAILLSILAYLGHLSISNIPRGEYGQIVYSKFMPVNYIDVVFTAAAAFAVFSFAIGVYKYWNALKREIDKSRWISMGSLYQSIGSTIVEILPHSQFRKCDYAKGRTNAHLLTFYGFIGLAVTTTWAIFYLYGLKWESPYPLSDPLKIWGNLSAVAFITGLSLIVLNRRKTSPRAGLGSYFDWLFITIIYTIAVTGILSEVLRLLNLPSFAYPVYFTHLVFVFFLFAYAPFSKMAHLVYRTVAIVFRRHVGDDLRLQSIIHK
jgi:quinone-modifying oxidoreductase subunit QmoC